MSPMRAVEIPDGDRAVSARRGELVLPFDSVGGHFFSNCPLSVVSCQSLPAAARWTIRESGTAWETGRHLRRNRFVGHLFSGPSSSSFGGKMTGRVLEFRMIYRAGDIIRFPVLPLSMPSG